MNPNLKTSNANIYSLEEHLLQENPVLLEAVHSFRDLDRIAHRMRLLEPHQSFAMQIPWWPLISILGTFSAGKSSFVNHYLGHKLQRTGNQAVDDRFSVICYSEDEMPKNLPGVALDQDPRFPFYQISKDLENVSPGEGGRIDAYLQLRTCDSERLRGKILIDSPGFDADAQRTATLKITDYIVNLSDLVLVLFDARHPEPGAMQDTLEHLVRKTIHRPDSGKFLYILNQIDTTAREDNPEDVVAAWQRALGEKGLTAGRFFTIYNPDVAIPIEDPAIRNRFESKRDADLKEIYQRMEHVGIERAYRIVGNLEKSAHDLEDKIVPFLTKNLKMWKTSVWWGSLLAQIAVIVVLLTNWANAEVIQNLANPEKLMAWLVANPTLGGTAIAAILIVMATVHFGIRSLVRTMLLWSMKQRAIDLGLRGNIAAAFRYNTQPLRSIFWTTPKGWSQRAKRELKTIIKQTDGYVQALNNQFAKPVSANNYAATSKNGSAVTKTANNQATP